MTRRKRVQRTLWEGVVDEDVRALWEPWMVEADKLLDDDELIDLVWAAQSERHEQSATRGRPQTPAEIALRLLLLKHVRNWVWAAKIPSSKHSSCLALFLCRYEKLHG
jgi:IS5 family transposase